jgi:uncharacterized protein YjbJ (UPF0337 family)
LWSWRDPLRAAGLLPEGFVAPQSKVSTFSFIAPRLVEEFPGALPVRVLQQTAKGRVTPHSEGSGESLFIVTMNALELKGDWNIISGKLKQKWAQLTDDDLQYIDGQREELLGRIQKRTGATRESVEEAIRDFRAAAGK